jgi:tRNA-dihydrouridine synthase B
MKTGTHLPAPTIEDRVKVCRTHLTKSVEWKGEHVGIVEMRRHYANYFKGLPNFKEIRSKLVTTDSFSEINELLDEVRVRYENVLMG